MAESNTLGIKDLHEVLEAVFEVRSSWFSFGLALGIDEPTLQSTSVACRDNPEACLREVLSVWLKNFQKPTWDDIVIALRSRIVGYKHVANNIICSKPCSEVTIDKDVMEEEATPSAKSQLPSDPVNAEQLQTAFQRAAKYAPVIDWLETNEKIGKQSDSIAGNQGTELQSRGVPESEQEITIEESHTVSSADSASTPQQNNRIHNLSNNYGTFSIQPIGLPDNVNQKIRRRRCFRGRCCCIVSIIVTFLLLLMICGIALIPSSMNVSFFIDKSGVTILAGQLFPFFDTNVTFETADESSQQHFEFYAERCADVMTYKELVERDGNYSVPGSYSLWTDYLLAGSSITISINITNVTNSEIIPAGCLSTLLVFQDPIQFVKFINTGQWTNPLAKECVQNTSLSYTFDVFRTYQYYIGLYIPSVLRLESCKIWYEISERALRYNNTGFKPGCFLSPSRSCSLSLERFGGHGPDVCLFALLTPDNGSDNKYTEFSYKLDNQSGFYILTFVPMGILFLAIPSILTCFACDRSYLHVVNT